MNNFDFYSYSRLCITQNIEFFFIVGVKNSDNFDEYWDGTTREIIGYLVIYTMHEQEKQNNLIYIVKNDNLNSDNIIRYTKKFASEMPLSPKIFHYDKENYKISMTTINPKGIVSPYIDFIQEVVGDDIPESILNQIDF